MTNLVASLISLISVPELSLTVIPSLVLMTVYSFSPMVTEYSFAERVSLDPAESFAVSVSWSSEALLDCEEVLPVPVPVAWAPEALLDCEEPS
jgi:hypothetical protein